MTDNFIKDLIGKLNKNKASESIFLRPLTCNVDFAIVWHSAKDAFSSRIKLFGPDKFYFIKNDDGIYVAAVNDGGGDLHWIVLPKYRGFGYLTTALKKTILPHIFHSNKKTEQRITVNRNIIGDKNYLASTNVAKSLGFIEQQNNSDKTELTISRDLFNGISVKAIDPIAMSDERIKLLKDRASEISKMLYKIESELEINFEQSDKMVDFKEITKCISKASNVIHDLQWG